MIERPDAVDTDPLLGVLRRRHPDVDIVLLPPQRVPATPPPTASLDEAVALEDRARAALLAALEAPGTSEEEPRIAALWWRQGLDGSHRHVARAGRSDLDDPMGVLADLAVRLGDQGWRVSRLLEPRPRVVATDGPLELRADAFPTAVSLQVVSEPLVLDAAMLRTLRARRRRGPGRAA